MVDAVVSFAVQKLGDFLIQQAVFLQGVRDEVVWLKDVLKMMQSCLKDAAEKENVLNAIKLIRLWVAAGFLSAIDQETLEEVAEDWLNKLVDRRLIQVETRNWQRITECRVHDLLRDLAVSKGKELNFLHIYEENINSAPASSTASSYRRHAAHSSIERYVSVGFSNQHLRTLLFFNRNGNIVNNIQVLTFIHTRFRLLRVLELESIRFSMSSSEEKQSLPKEIGDLIHLRCLGMRETKIKQLRHLIGRFEGLLGIEHLTNLQTLDCVDICSWIKINPLNLNNLRKLELVSHRRIGGEVEEFGFDSIGNLRNLQSSYVQSDSVEHIHSFQLLSHCRHLIQLGIQGRLIEINLSKQLHDYLLNLKYMVLGDGQLKQDPMPTLEKLPNLMILTLDSVLCIDSRKLIFTGSGFPRLEALGLYNLEWLEELEVSEGAMLRLKVLQIDCCHKLMVLERLKSVNLGDISKGWELLDLCASVHASHIAHIR